MNKVDGRMQMAVEGSGGQGIVLFGLLFAKAASLEGFNVSFVPVYGSTITGGRSRSDVILSKVRIMHPLVEGRPDILVVFDNEAYERNAKAAGAREVFVGEAVKAEGVLRVPNVSIASRLGSKVVANIVTLGFVAGKTGMLSAESLKKAIRQTVPKEFVELNLKAFDAGLREAGH